MSELNEALRALRERPFGSHPELIRFHARQKPRHPALIQDDRKLDYASLDSLLDRIAAALQRDGVCSGDTIAICASTSIEYAAVFMGGLRAGAGIAPLAPSSTAESLAAMLKDCGASLVFLDATVAALLHEHRDRAQTWITLDGSAAGTPFEKWLAPLGATPTPVELDPNAAFNIIYSSGTTGTPKGIVQSHSMRWLQLRRDPGFDYAGEGKNVVMISTPLYSNTTLVSFLPTLCAGGTLVLMAKFEATRFLQLAERHRVTHSMLVPVQYHRLLAVPDFDRYDLSSFVMKYSTSAPFSAALKAEILRRWPGGLIEYYGMTEGGGSCALAAHEHPDKLHTVGQPMPGHDIRLLDPEGNEVPQGEVGEIVGRSPVMMNGYYNQPQKTAEAYWWDRDGNRYIRSGDVGRFDADGFLTLLDRKTDLIISGGFNDYPSDLEAVLTKHEAVSEAAVVGVPSAQWGETPIAFVVLRTNQSIDAAELCRWTNERLGKTQRLNAVELVASLPRSPIGKVLKRELRDLVKCRP